jgi:HEAT repeat protein
VLPVVPFEVLLPLAAAAGSLVLLFATLILGRRAFVRWWSEGGRRQRRKAASLVRIGMEKDDSGRLERWISRGRAARIHVLLATVEELREDVPGVGEWLQGSSLPDALALLARFPRGRIGSLTVPGGRWRRVLALKAIGVLDLPRKDVLLECLDDPDQEVAYAAAEAVAVADFPDGARAIFERIGPRSPLLDSRLATAVESMGSDLTDVLREALAADRTAPRYWALTLIGRKRVYELAEDVRPHLAHEDPDVRVAACKALGLLKVRLTDRWLGPLLRDNTWFVQAQAVKALGGMKSGWAAEEIAGLLTSPHWWVRQNATQALGELGAEAMGSVERVLDSNDRYARHSAVEVLARTGWVERTVVRASGGDEEAARTLERYARSGGLGHLENALQQVPDPAVPFLLGLLERLGDDATYGRIRAARYRFSPELQTLCMDTADRVRAR